MTTIVEHATELRRLHTAPELLQVVNVWDVVSARAVAALPGTKALATASHSIAATFGYEDGEQIPVELMLDMVGRIARAVDVPVSADLEAGYGDAGETIRRAIGEGIVGANLEDQLKPLDESVAAVRASVAAADAEGVPFALNARTDAFLRGRDRTLEVNVADAIERGRAYLDAGATSVFVPGIFGEDVVRELVSGIGELKVTLIGLPGVPAPERLQELGVARVSYGPTIQRVALGALQDLATDLYLGGVLPEGIRPLN
ncbi:2-Methylisocitrate lyase, PEP mutase family [Agromyces sp. CF514]|uniref:isocitrate lyase/PEP mutase family protein n=1 Tax=Agromyces sp. CF514 TaxID=1881031 RepID=UPI0008F1A6C9|nr:isocitrate lyase/phosphoenolpyruvate mutase family protein [Agromyces sp. CF514]SFR68238.1 2-Methylisocitrate lyase, PEP mutase family [Agromyces sp. CF514]